jgi:peptidoglycan/LPS O-acetylase OafA/YrhL
MSTIFNNNSKRIAELDGIRGVALLMVLIYHLINNTILITYKPSFFEVALRKSTFFTWSALDLFFVLSGYLIAKILIENRGSKRFFYVFYFRRIIRIMPLFYLLLVCYIILKQTGIQDPEGFLFANELPLWSYFSYIQNYMMAFSDTYGSRIITPTWSLGIDEQFYLFLPFIIYFFKKKWIPFIVIPLIIAAPIFRASTDLYYMKILPFQMRMDGLFVGVLLAYLVCEKDLVNRIKGKSKIIFAAVVLLLGFIFFLTYFRKIGVLDHSLFNIVFALLILSAISFRNSIYCKILSSKFLQFFGFVSYGTYLFHQFISGILHAVILNQQPRLENMMDVWVTLITVVLSLFVGYVLHVKIEKPLINIGHRLKYN